MLWGLWLPAATLCTSWFCVKLPLHWVAPPNIIGVVVQDAQRNAAYQRAIERAIDMQRAAGAAAVHVLDIGAGSGLLSLMAARCSAAALLSHDADSAALEVLEALQHAWQVGSCERACLTMRAVQELPDRSMSVSWGRAGADHVTGAEVCQHMCDVAAEVVVMNGYAAKCLMVNKDVRRMDASAKPDGTPPDMEHRANLCIFEASAPMPLWSLHRS